MVELIVAIVCLALLAAYYAGRASAAEKMLALLGFDYEDYHGPNRPDSTFHYTSMTFTPSDPDEEDENPDQDGE